MNKFEACKILGLSGEITPEMAKKAYRKACIKYHPDKNSGGLEMMKSVNLAYSALKDLQETINIKDDCINYGDELMNVINVLSNIANLHLEICGSWLWITGDTKANKDNLKSLNCLYAPKKVAWYYRPSDYKSRGKGKLSLDEIREKHGSREVKKQTSNKLAVA